MSAREKAFSTKVCTSCKELLPLEKFSVNRTCPDGRTTICKSCFTEKYVRKQCEFRKTEEGRALLRQQRRNRPITENARKRERRHSKKYRDAYPEKEMAKRYVRSALERGTLFRPNQCDACGSNPGTDRAGRTKIQAHHIDYRQPLNVIWLCPLCHAREHRSLKGGRDAQ